MKTKIIWISLVFILSLSTCIMPQQASARGYVSSQVFYDGLSPYGTWVYNYDYGYGGSHLKQLTLECLDWACITKPQYLISI